MKNLKENLLIVNRRNRNKNYSGLRENAATIQLSMDFDDNETIFRLPDGESPDDKLTVYVCSHEHALSIKDVQLDKNSNELKMTLFDKTTKRDISFSCKRKDIGASICNPSAIIEFIVRNRA